MADIEFVHPASALVPGVKDGINIGQMIQEERRLQQTQKFQMQQAEQKDAMGKVSYAVELMAQPWASDKFKLELYNQMKPFSGKMGIPLPDLMEWPKVGTESAKRMRDALKTAEKLGMKPEDTVILLSDILLDASEKERQAAEPLLAGFKDKAGNQAKMAEIDSRNRQTQTDRNQRFDDAQTTRMAATLEKAGVPAALSKFKKIFSLIPKPGDDIPGYGRFDSLKPDFLAGDAGRDLRQAIQDLANVQIKDQSGATVTPPEFDRFLKAFGAGVFKTERQLREGLQNALNSYRERLQNALGGFTPEVQASYYANNGMDNLTDTFNNFSFADSQPKTVVQNGFTYTLNEETGKYE